MRCTCSCYCKAAGVHQTAAVSSRSLHLTSILSLAMWQLQLAVISSYLAMPHNPKSDGSVMTVWLQVRAVS
jgi:hypothetical protein